MADEPSRQGWRERKGEQEGGEQRRHHRQGQCPEEDSGESVQKGQRDEDDHRGESRADQRRDDVADAVPDCGEAFAAFDDAGVDGFHDHDGVVDDEPDGGGDSAQGHEIEAHPEQVHYDQRHQHRDRYDGHRGQRGTPVAQEEVDDDHGEDQPEEDGFPDSADGGADQHRLVIIEIETRVGGQDRAKVCDLFTERVGDIQGAAVGLAADVEKDGVDPLGGYDVIDGFGASLDLGEVTDADWVTSGCGHRQCCNLVGILEAAVHDGQVEQMVFLVQSGRGHRVTGIEGVGDVGEG